MWTQVKSWLNTEVKKFFFSCVGTKAPPNGENAEVKFSTEIKSRTGLSSFRLSCDRTLSAVSCGD